MRRPALVPLALCALLLGGCTYYRIREPSGGPDYYTNNWAIQNGWNGAVRFRDYRSGDVVVLQQHQSREITKEEFNEAISAPATPQATKYDYGTVGIHPPARGQQN
jgi:hypothetical protein